MVRCLAFGPSEAPGCNTTRPFPAAGPVGRMARCEKEPAVILVLDQAQADLGGSELRCPDCSGQLRRWGFARTRSLRCSGGGRVTLRPRRVRCASCRVTHVLLPALAPPHRAYTSNAITITLDRPDSPRVLTAASDDDEGVTFGDDVKSRRGRVRAGWGSSWCRGRRHAVAVLRAWLRRRCVRLAAAHRREKLPAGDHRDDLPWRRGRAEPADRGRRGGCESG